MEEIEIQDFKKIDLRVGLISEVQDIGTKKPMFVLTLDLGSEKRTVVAGIKSAFAKEDLVGKKVVFVSNLAPKKIMDVESHGMLLIADDGKSLSLVSPASNIEPGAKIE
ncbi:MAG: methionine--tRNA ligase subunit beta [Candidatus Marsarchaeota archaeon]|nr:methionine--tRNA ligase subunit beta [Candidatus Marsarchaeota archaeon]MCL5106173.1 methionine--tRNA ligase subunit beta [Candidatus Marsarchaeota archaeon]